MDKDIIYYISPQRSNNYSDWIYIGIALYNVFGEEEGYELWNIFSSWSNKYNLDECNHEWNKFKNIKESRTSYGSLLYYAYKDRPRHA